MICKTRNSQQMLFNGDVALITGAGRGIGRAIALCFARKGARIALTGRDMGRLELVAHEIKAVGGEAAAFSLDVTRDDDAGRVAEEVIGKWGRIDVLVNNAGVITYDTPLWATTMEQWDEVMNTNLRGMHQVCRAVIPHMVRRKRGVIINLGSSSGRRPDSEYGAYATSKWGVVGYTASLAQSLRPYGIRVNGINPDWVDTNMARAYNPSGNPEWIAPEEVAQAALYLAAQAPAMMTGQFIDLFGN
ncbi:MAG: SDR family oxidoreductase [Chloroflexi bacterium]|nr:SDR family oxidoreductase [Chloroflexota bacterium]MYE41359.1 SDR family oxidoreductase [Chloroflexota bacterium]